MATKRRKRRSRKPVRTKKGGRRKYKISCKKSRKSYKMRGLEDMPNEMLSNIFENSSFTS